MERLKIADLDNSLLRIGMKGYDRAQVDVLLERARNEISLLQSELKTTREELDRQRERLATLSGQENALKDTLLIAQRAAEEVRGNAHREADAIVAQAHRVGEETQRQFNAKINDLRWELERLRNERQRFASEFRNSLEGFMRALNEDSFMTPQPQAPTQPPAPFTAPEQTAPGSAEALVDGRAAIEA